MTATNRFLLALACAAVPMLAGSHEAHVHGEAPLTLAIDGNALNIDLEMPLDSLVGFEHAPRTPAQKSAYADGLKALHAGAQLFVLPEAAQCKPERAGVADPFGDARQAKGGHADIDAEYEFRCANIAALRSVEVRLFASAPRLRKLNVQLAVPGAQRAATLTPKNAVLRW